MRCADPWFVAKDACDCMVITNVSQACQALDDDEKGICETYTLGGSQDIWIGRLEKARRISAVLDMIQAPILDSAGVPHETTLYNLNVLNQLAMACIDNIDSLLDDDELQADSTIKDSLIVQLEG